MPIHKIGNKFLTSWFHEIKNSFIGITLQMFYVQQKWVKLGLFNGNVVQKVDNEGSQSEACVRDKNTDILYRFLFLCQIIFLTMAFDRPRC
jgi:hypothetical protein